jgi:HAMP domain-containing protein
MAKPFVSSELATAMDNLVAAGILFIIASALYCWFYYERRR